ncbi:hypothetical protein BELL_0105g00090 [Botrytis elliptica]|uniref:Ig-like domain-containing protein n=1 Tax=Botrytis elliptica TaxID=278938 RepID=A0A4Z1JWD2_9HELO|nr:hypothetical protein EAE99_009744 [Botrytis elliptica]TGO77494.1 hypothetical protein BELL_0105g00090 [Botrytis elliptica]
MKLLFSIPLVVSALVAEATTGGDAVNNQVHNEARIISNGGVDLPGTSLVTVNNVVVASTLSSAFGDSSAAASSLSDNFPPVSPGHTNVRSSAYKSTTVVLSTITVTPQKSVDVTSVTHAFTSPSAIDSQGAALVSPTNSGAAITSNPSPATSDITKPIVLVISSLEPEPSSSAATIAPPSSTLQSSAVQSSIVESSAAPTLTAESAPDNQYTYSASPTESSAVLSTAVPSLPSQSLTIQPTPLQSSAAQTLTESGTRQVSIASSLPTIVTSDAPFLSGTASTVQSLSKSVTYPNHTIASVSSTSSLSTSATSIIVGTPTSNSASIPKITPPSPPYKNGTSTPATDNIGTTSTSATSTTTITSTTTRTGTITTTITRSSADVTSQSIIGKLPDTDGPYLAAPTTETFTSGGRTWTTTETGPPSTVTASLMLNPSYSASSNGGVVSSNGAAPSSGACTCPSQVTVTVTATPFVVTGGTLTATGSLVASSANSPEESSGPSLLRAYYPPPQASWTTHSIPGFIGVTIPSGGMSYPAEGSATYSPSTTPTNSPSLSHTHPYMSIEPTPNLSAFSNYSTTSAGSLLGTAVGTAVGTVITPNHAPTTKASVGLPPAASVTPAIYTGNADVNVAGTESVALIVGFVALVVLF